MSIDTKIARALLAIDAVGFRPSDPITFVSGLKAPVYVDNRKFPFWPKEWRLVINGFAQRIKETGMQCDVIAGIEAAGIPHSAALAFMLKKPSVFVRKQSKEHGTKSRIEGGKVKGGKVVLIEDLVTTGGSSLAGVEALRDEGASVTDCLVIVTYGFPEIQKLFRAQRVRLHALTSFPLILDQAQKMKRITPQERILVEDWLREPHGWAKRHGF